MKPATTTPRTRIREIRKLRGWTLKDLANATGTTPQTIQRLETATMTVSMSWLARIGEAMDVTPNELLPDPDAKPTPERAFLNALAHAVISNRRAVPEIADVFPVLVEEMGKLSGLTVESRKGLRPWGDVYDQTLAVAAAAMRIAIDGRALRGVKLGEAA